ncbi:hypothetical protein BDN72DRAFT_896624 [Pluteus cervinus]|uniref:Uncharacterized protein n=1 Tax=Pluteus cervinus TaxID=181527 RepID=A0ACD3AY49_9AGAR|nr:hypothetical protein BDN72DRAFT_896624 [Pluteus cervinus]
MLVVTFENIASVVEAGNLDPATRRQRLNAVRIASRIVLLFGLLGMHLHVTWIGLPKEAEPLYTLRILAGLWHYAALFSVRGWLIMYSFSPRDGVNIDISVIFNVGAAIVNARKSLFRGLI